MNILEFLVVRDTFNDHDTLGKMYVGGMYFGETLEDCDRELEKGGIKVQNETAIGRGTYPLTATLSNRFGRLMPLVEDVPQFDGVRIHGGNTDKDTHGCILLGRVRGDNQILNCAERNTTLLKLITDAEARGTQCKLTVK